MKYLIMLILLFPLIANAREDIEYFPKGKLSSDSGWYGSGLIEYYSVRLVAMQEPSLWEMSKNKQQSESYRFLLNPEFENPVCIRIEINNFGEITIYTKVFKRDLDSKEAGYPGELIVNKKKFISKKDIQSLMKQIDDVKFWDLKSDDFPAIDVKRNIATLGGNIYIFEGVKNGEYQAVEIPMIHDGSKRMKKIYELGRAFLALGDLN